MKKRGDTMSLRIDGKKISSDIKEELKEQVKLLKEEGISVCLAVIQVGSDSIRETLEAKQRFSLVSSQ